MRNLESLPASQSIIDLRGVEYVPSYWENLELVAMRAADTVDAITCGHASLAFWILATALAVSIYQAARSIARDIRAELAY
jgi:hypothetical protein